MRQLVVLAMTLLSVCAFAQRPEGREPHRRMMADLSVEQLATLHTKKLTLALDLTESQQSQMMEISLEEAKFRKERRKALQSKKEKGKREKPTADERFEMANARLDHKIAHQQKIKKVLTGEQYKLWKELHLKRAMKGKKTVQKDGRRG